MTTLHGNELIMKAINFTITKVNVNLQLLSIVLRVPYFIMDSIAATGDTSLSIFVEDVYRQATLIDKINILEECYSAVGLEESFQVIGTLKRAYNQMKAVKHPERRILLAYNKLMHNIGPIYEKHINIIVTELKMNDLVEMKGILDINTFSLLEVVSEREYKFKENHDKITTAMLLQSIQANQDEEPRILVLPCDLVNSEFIKGKMVYQYSDPEALDENEIYLHKCLTIPAPVSLTASQLKVVRSAIRDTAINFNIALTEWGNCFTNKENAKTKIDKFVNDVTSKLPAIQNAIDNNSILQFLKFTSKDNLINVNVWIGEAPLPVIWEYFKINEMMDDDCYSTLFSTLSLNTELKNRIPIMVIDTEGAFSSNSANENQPDMTEDILAFTRRKFIHVN